MIRLAPETPRVATRADAATVARLLDAFNREFDTATNREFDTATPGPLVLAKRLERLLAGEETIALLAGDPAGTRVGLLCSMSSTSRRSCADREWAPRYW